MIVIMAGYNSYTNTPWLDRSDKHTEAELKTMDIPQLKIELKKAIDANDTDYVSEEEIENAMLASKEELDAYLFHRVPNYITLLEEVTLEFLTEYLS